LVVVVVASLFGHVDGEEPMQGILVLAVLWQWRLSDRILKV
jgi:hypothetical protein